MGGRAVFMISSATPLSCVTCIDFTLNERMVVIGANRNRR